jgi:hypothetical protein
MKIDSLQGLPGQRTTEDIVPVLQRFIIRHLKNMRIGGDVALRLPDQNFHTIRLDMSADERKEYSKRTESAPPMGEMKLFTLELRLASKRNRAGNFYDFNNGVLEPPKAGNFYGMMNGVVNGIFGDDDDDLEDAAGPYGVMVKATTECDLSKLTKLNYLINDLNELRA